VATHTKRRKGEVKGLSTTTRKGRSAKNVDAYFAREKLLSIDPSFWATRGKGKERNVNTAEGTANKEKASIK